MAFGPKRRDEAEGINVRVETGQSESLMKELAESKRTSLETLVPRPGDMEGRIPLVTAFTGRAPNLIHMLRAQATLALRHHLSHLNNGSKGLDLSLPSPIIEWLKEHAPSVNQTRAQQIVEIARSTVPQEATPSFWRRKK